jgi:EAL domain-containing protein (putative c-di-GMP-specific phosphodiesterase class I)
MLELEVTESSLMEDAEQALSALHSLRAMGIPLHIDDFGTGYSSLSYLQKLPVNCIKIDQSFVQSMCADKDAAVIVRSTIDLLHDLGRKAVAEGVETQEAWDELARLHCDIAQGYFIAKPMPAGDFPEWLDEFVLSGPLSRLVGGGPGSANEVIDRAKAGGTRSKGAVSG